jgi:gamma-glutamyltranspeptidase/glutathione hydrolase
LIGKEANAIEPGKRPLSSMTPTPIFKDGAPYVVTGSPGGSRIITTVLQLLVNVMDHNMNIAEASSASKGSLQSIMLEKGLFFGASDTRRPGAGAVGVN